MKLDWLSSGLALYVQPSTCLQTGWTKTSALFSSPTSNIPANSLTLDDLKTDLVRICNSSLQSENADVQQCVKELEQVAEAVGVGQASSTSRLLNGEWDLLYSPEDVTRSSPFFWAFKRAFPDNAAKIFAITDAIPSLLKEIGPAVQEISIDENQAGKLVSRVKVASLNGQATSMMTTKVTVMGAVGNDGLILQIETTQPEDSTIVRTLLGPFSSVLNNSLPAFPSGQALEKVMEGSSRVTMRTTFCDESLRISRNADSFDEVFVWKRRSFELDENSF